MHRPQHLNRYQRKQLVIWLQSGVVRQNIKSDLRETIDALHALCTMATVTKDVIHSVLGDILTTNEIFRNKQAAHVTLWGWFQESEVSVFNKERRRILGVCETMPSNSSPPPPLQHHFSFSPREQGGIVEEFLNFAERNLFQFLVRNANCVTTTEVASFGDKSRPKIKPDFANADTLSMLNFIIAYKDNYKTSFQGENKENAIEILTNYKKNVRNQMAHGVLQGTEGRWNDYMLQLVAIQTCEVTVCLGGSYTEVYGAKYQLDKDIIERIVNNATNPPSKPKGTKRTKCPTEDTVDGDIHPPKKQKDDEQFEMSAEH
ncbi:hypothetical protein BC936DRAFT_140079 [Jimgerdemannia flammicorona]|uniref:Apea-like HEPN domain-containing protein n=1 Tax=Jimgerdemannia flammicorona TaxID=994334 RepID=A0A433DH58_9FUNG|nr:hypothetical protein BC936DRAFT_140079 [Jimgerdemannia flammicorona]